MTVQQAREAAKKLNQWLDGVSPWLDENDRALSPRDYRDATIKSLADFILDHFPEDGEERVTEEWLREEYGWDNPGTMSVHYERDKHSALVFNKTDGLRFVAKSHGMRVYTSGFPITTRHQARQLFQALGIKKRGEA